MYMGFQITFWGGRMTQIHFQGSLNEYLDPKKSLMGSCWLPKKRTYFLEECTYFFIRMDNIHRVANHISRWENTLNPFPRLSE